MITCHTEIFGFQLWSHEVNQAYLQSAHQLMLDLYVKPSQAFEVEPNQLFKLLKSLYGLPGYGDYWLVTS